MATPTLHPDNVKDGSGPGLTYRIEGTFYPRRNRGIKSDTSPTRKSPCLLSLLGRLS